MLLGKLDILCREYNKVFSIEIGEDFPVDEDSCKDIKLVTRKSFSNAQGDVSVYKYNDVYIVTLYNTSSEVIWSIATEVIEAINFAEDYIRSTYTSDLVNVIKRLLQNDDDAKLEAEKLIRDIDELKQVFDEIRSVAKQKAVATK